MRRIVPLFLLLICLPVWAQETARPTLAQANRLRTQGQMDEAIKAFTAIAATPVNDDEKAQALFGLASIHFNRDQAKALDCYRQVAALKGAAASYRQTAWRQIASLARNAGDVDTAREAIKHLLTDFPNDPENMIAATLELAGLEMADGRPVAASPILLKLLTTAEKSPRLPDVYGALAQAQGQAGDLKGASATARAGWAKFPQRTDLMVGLAAAYEQAGKPAEAAGVMQELLLRKPDEPDLFRSLYELDKKAGKLPQLAAWLDKQAQADPFDLLWLGHLSRLYEWESDVQAGLRTQERLVERRPTDARILQDAGQAALRAKAFDKAAKWLEQALALEPDNQALVVLSGEVQLRQGNTEQALATWKRGLKYDPQDAQAVYNLGGILTRYDLDEEAVKLYLEARATGDKPEAYSLNLAQAYETLGDLPAGVREYALALSPQAKSNASLAALRLNRLAEDEAARPEVIKALQDLKQQGKLSTEGLVALLYAQGLAGPEQALQALETDKPEVLRNLLPRLASRLEAAGHSEVAAACYQRLLQEPLPPDYAAALALHLAELQQHQGDWRGALATLTAQKLDKLQSGVAAQLALERAELLLRRARRPVEALGAYNQTIEVEPDGPFTLKARWGEADVAFALGKYDLALAAYHGLLGQDQGQPQIVGGGDFSPTGAPTRGRRLVLPGEDYVAFQEAEALFRQAKYKEAEKAFRAMAKANAASPYANDALERVVLLGSLQGHPAGATEYLQAVSAFERGEADRAIPLLTGITTPPLADASLLLLGEIRLWEGKTPEALTALDRLAAADPPGVLAPQARYLAAMALILSNQPEAQKRLEALVDKHPDSPQAEQAKVVLENWRRQAEKR